MHISDVVLQASRQALRLAAECADEHVAVELHLLAVKLWLGRRKGHRIDSGRNSHFCGQCVMQRITA
jgi:hypothetical protein